MPHSISMQSSLKGSPRSRGPNSERLIQWVAAQPQREGRQEGGETVPGVRGALAEGATVWGSNADDSQIRDSLTSQGMSTEDVLGFYTLRTVPQWLPRAEDCKRRRCADTHTLIDAELAHNRERLGASSDDFAEATRPGRNGTSALTARRSAQPSSWRRAARLPMDDMGQTGSRPLFLVRAMRFCWTPSPNA